MCIRDSPVALPKSRGASSPQRQLYDDPCKADRRARYVRRTGAPSMTQRTRPLEEIPLTDEPISPIARDQSPSRTIPMSDNREEID